MYPMRDGEKMPPTSGSLGFNTIFQFSLYCKREGKEDEIPFVQAVIVLYEDPKERKCKFRDPSKCPSQVLLAKAGRENPLNVLLTPSKGALDKSPLSGPGRGPPGNCALQIQVISKTEATEKSLPRIPGY